MYYALYTRVYIIACPLLLSSWGWTICIDGMFASRSVSGRMQRACTNRLPTYSLFCFSTCCAFSRFWATGSLIKSLTDLCSLFSVSRRRRRRGHGRLSSFLISIEFITTLTHSLTRWPGESYISLSLHKLHYPVTLTLVRPERQRAREAPTNTAIRISTQKRISTIL